MSACFRSTPIPKLLYRPVLWGRALASSRSQWRDSLCIGTGASRRPALFPKLFPIPDPMRHLARQWRSELMRDHADLPAMVSFVRKHVAKHFHTNWPRLGPPVSAKLLDAVLTAAKSFSQHLRAASGALGQRPTCLLRRGVRAVELSWNLQVWSGKPDPLGSDIVHVRKNRCDGRTLPGGLAVHAAASRCSIRSWFMRSLAANICAADRSSGGCTWG